MRSAYGGRVVVTPGELERVIYVATMLWEATLGRVIGQDGNATPLDTDTLVARGYRGGYELYQPVPRQARVLTCT